MEISIKRSRTSDFIKGVAIVAMVQVVLMEVFATQNVMSGIVGKISLFLGGPPAAPVFLTVMGYYVAKSNYPFLKHIERGLKLIFLGLFINFGRNIVYWINPGHHFPEPHFLQFFLGTDILILAGISLMVLAVLIRLFKGHLLIFLFLTLVVLLLKFILPPVASIYPNSVWMPLLYGNYNQSYFPFIPWFAYVLSGYAFFQIKNYFVSEEFKHSKTVKIILLISSWIVLLATARFGFDVSISPKLFFHHGILFYLFCINYVFWWLLMARAIVHKFNNKITGYIEWLGKNVTTFYVFFILLIGNIAVFFYKKETIPYLIIWFIGFMILSSLLVWSWNTLVRKK